MMKKKMMIIRINDKDGEFGGMLEDWTFGLLLYLTYENLFESGGQIQITDATQSHHIARQTLGTTNLLVLIDRDITEGIALKLQQPKNDWSASTNNPRLRIIDYIVCVRILRILCISSCIPLFFLLPRYSSCIIPIFALLPPVFYSSSILSIFCILLYSSRILLSYPLA